MITSFTGKTKNYEIEKKNTSNRFMIVFLQILALVMLAANQVRTLLMEGDGKYYDNHYLYLSQGHDFYTFTDFSHAVVCVQSSQTA